MFFLLWYFDVFCHGTFVGDWGAQDKPWISIRFLFPKGALKRPESQRLLQKVLALDVFLSHSCHDSVWCVLEMLAPCILWYT